MNDGYSLRSEADERYLKGLDVLIKELRSFSASNFEYYKSYDDKNSLRFMRGFSILLDLATHSLSEDLHTIVRAGKLHDFSPLHPANGYRSFAKLIEKCMLHLLTMVRYIASRKSSFFFRNEFYSKELEAYVNLLSQLKALLQYVVKYSQHSPYSLIKESTSPEVENTMMEIQVLSQEPFFGICLGFQFVPSILQPLNMIHLIMASYKEVFNQGGSFYKIATTILNSPKYAFSPETRAKKVVASTQDGDVTFCKSFWSLTENNIFQSLSKFVSPVVGLEITITVPAKPVDVLDDKNNNITIHPSSHGGDPADIQLRLISYTAREGQLKGNVSKMYPPSDYLLIHVHGGGFVAQSSASHAVYLRLWAKELDIPIVSIDYSLAPEFSYPRQVEEVFFVYCWILGNLHFMGSTGKRILLVGDSAGGNLALAMVLKCIQKEIRSPEGILCVYGCFLVRYTPTASRFMTILDPILPLGILTKCLAAYIGVDISTKEKKNGFLSATNLDNKINDQKEENPMKVETEKKFNEENISKKKSLSSQKKKTILVSSNLKKETEVERNTQNNNISVFQLSRILSKYKSFWKSEHFSLVSSSSSENFISLSSFSKLSSEDSKEVNLTKKNSKSLNCLLFNFNQKETKLEKNNHDLFGTKNNKKKKLSRSCNDVTYLRKKRNSDEEKENNIRIKEIKTKKKNRSLEKEGVEKEKEDQFLDCYNEIIYEESFVDYSDNVKTNDSSQSLSEPKPLITSFKKTDILTRSIVTENLCQVKKSNKKKYFLKRRLSLQDLPKKKIVEKSKSCENSHYFNLEIENNKNEFYEEDEKDCVYNNISKNNNKDFKKLNKKLRGSSVDKPLKHSKKEKEETIKQINKKNYPNSFLFPESAILKDEEDESVHFDYHLLLEKINTQLDPLLSPIFASDEILSKIRDISFVCCNFDPLLDETIYMATKVRKAKKSGVTLDVVDELPHGFLNFCQLSKEAYNATKLCCEKLKELMRD